MMLAQFTFDDMKKLEKAYWDLDHILDLIDKTNKEYGENHKPSGFLVDAHQCLKEVLFGKLS